MPNKVKPVPEGYHTVTPYLAVQGAEKTLDFVKRAFGAKEIYRMARPDGTLWHAEVKIGDSMVMIGEVSPPAKPMPATLNLYVEDADAVYKRAIESGAKSLREPADQFYGDRSGGVEDPAGNNWWISTHVEDVSSEEIQRRAAAAAKQQV